MVEFGSRRSRKGFVVLENCDMILPPDGQVTSVFRGLERGEEDTGTIQPGQLPSAMRSLGLNPSEQEVIDIPNYITRQARILECNNESMNIVTFILTPPLQEGSHLFCRFLQDGA